MKKTGKQSGNIVDVRKGRARDIYNKSRETADAGMADYTGFTKSLVVTSDQKKAAKKLGLGSSLADLQNQANKLEARKRTRFTTGTDREVVKSLTKRTK